jgi:hypothetical protein
MILGFARLHWASETKPTNLWCDSRAMRRDGFASFGVRSVGDAGHFAAALLRAAHLAHAARVNRAFRVVDSRDALTRELGVPLLSFRTRKRREDRQFSQEQDHN